jgi:hypothetical protein
VATASSGRTATRQAGGLETRKGIDYNCARSCASVTTRLLS